MTVADRAVRTFLQPVVNLLEALSFPRKFALLSAVFMVPLAVTLPFSLAQIDRQLIETRAALADTETPDTATLAAHAKRLEFARLALWLVTILSLTAAAVLWTALNLSLTTTVRSIQDAARRLKSGDESALVRIETRDSLRRIGRAFNEVARELAGTARRYRSLFEGSVDGIFRTTPDGTFLEANSALARMYKFRSAADLRELAGQATSLYVDPRRRQRFQELIERDGVIRDFESEVRCADGSTIWINENARLIRDDNGKPLYYEGIVRDISDRRREATALQCAIQAADAANRTKSEFLANMSHEIRTPMNAILGFAELLEGLVRDERPRSYLKAIRSSGETLLALINDLLDLSKIEAGRLALTCAPVDLEAVLHDIRHIFSHKAAQNGIELSVAVDPAVPQGLMMDEVRLRQILFNVVGNAIKFTHHGEVSVRAGLGPGSSPDAIELVVEVEDTGIGIPAEDRERIFEAFSQVGGQNARLYGGTGLGLAITRRLVEMMDGRVELLSEVGKGSLFRFTFPHVPPAPTPPTTADPDPDGDPADFAPCRILVVDDLVLNRDLIRAILHGSEHEMLEASDSREAIEVAERARPDLVVLSVGGPVSDDEKVIRRLRSHPALRDIPLIGVTASAPRADEAILESLCDGFLRKPVTRGDLANQMRRYCRPRPLPDPPRAAAARDEVYRSELAARHDEWLQLTPAPLVADVERFGRRLLRLAETYQRPLLHEYARRLIAAASRFDIPAMETTLQEFGTVFCELGRRALSMP